MTAALLAWAQQAAPAHALAVARTKLERGSSGDAVRLSVASDPSERAELGRLLGLAWQGSGQPVTLGRLRRACVDQGTTLDEVLVALGGSLRDRRAERAADLANQQGSLAAAQKTLIAAGVPAAVLAIADEHRWAGSPSAPETVDRLTVSAAVWLELPQPGHSRMLPELASTVGDSPHVLDRSRKLGRLTARLLAAYWALEDGMDAAPAVLAASRAVADSAAWRETWARARVVCDRVSSTVLVLNLRLVGSAPAVGTANAAAEAGDPLWITARSLEGEWTPSGTTDIVRVCENPSIVEAAADAHGTTCAPLICTFGRPSVAAWMLLEGLARAGVDLLVSADRDVAGRQIEDDLLVRLGTASPWLPAVAGVYEEDRLHPLIENLRPQASGT